MARLAALSLPGRVYLGRAAAEPVRRLPSGLAVVDAVLGGGVPRGRISEVLGPPASGKTSVVLALLAAATRRGEVAAWIDLPDALHPASAAACGIDLRRLLWVRPHTPLEALRSAELLLQAGGFALVVLDLDGVAAPWRGVRHAHAWPRVLAAAERSHTAVVLLAPRRVAGSFAALGLGLRARAQWRPGAWPLFEGFDGCVHVVRNKLGASGRQAAVAIGWNEANPRPPALDRRFPEAR